MMRNRPSLATRQVKRRRRGIWGRNSLGTNDGSGDQLGEERDEKEETREPVGRCQLAAIDVDRVAHRLERVEADPHRQDHVEPPQVRPADRCHQGVDLLDAEVHVLEEAEEPEVGRQRDDEKQLPTRRPDGKPRDLAAGEEVDDDASEQDGEVGGDVPSVEYDAAGDQQHDVRALGLVTTEGQPAREDDGEQNEEREGYEAPGSGSAARCWIAVAKQRAITLFLSWIRWLAGTRAAILRPVCSCH